MPSFWSCNLLSNNIILVYISLYKQAACIYLLAIMHSLFLVLHGLFLTALHDLTVHNKIHCYAIYLYAAICCELW